MKKYKSSRSRQWWAALHEEWESSGQSIVDFCKKRGVRFQSFYNWRSKFMRDGVVSKSVQKAKELLAPVKEQPMICSGDRLSFIELPVSSGQTSCAAITLESPTGWRVQIHSANTWEALHNAVRLLEDLS